MVLGAYILLLSATAHLTLCHPVYENLRLPEINVSNPFEINNLNYFDADIDSDPEESKLFRRTVGNFEKSVNYIDKTVREVEALLDANSTLPRLTRGEILEIIENITKSDLEAVEKNKTKERDQKAIMLVMPYTPQNTDDDKMQELFTKKPVTKMIGDAPKPSEADLKPNHKRRKRPLPQTPEGAFYGEVFPEPLPDRTTEKIPEKKPLINVDQAKPETTEKPLQNKLPPVFTQRPLITTTTKNPNHELEIITGRPFSEEPSIQRAKQRRGSTTLKPPQKMSTEISMNTNTQSSISLRKRRPTKSPQRHPNHKYPEQSQSAKQSQGLNIIEPPKLGSTVNLPSTVKSTESTTKTWSFFTYPTSVPPKPSKHYRSTTAKPFLADVNLPDDLKTTFEDLELGDSVPKIPPKFSTQYDDTANLPSPPPLNENIRDLLASIGVLPSTTTIIPDISNVADTLTPDMKQLLMSFGLLPDPNRKPEDIKEEPVLAESTADISPSSYVQFKPLPDNGPTRTEMEEFLGRFGLGRDIKDTRNQKALNDKKPEKVLTEVPAIEIGMVPDSMKDVISDLGLTVRQEKKISAETGHKNLDQNDSLEKTTEKQHVFNPMEPQYAAQDELEKLSQLLDIIKQLEKLNGSATEESLSKVDLKNLKDLMGSFNKEEFVPLDEQNGAPNPLNYDYGLSKNEVKRQENSTSTVAVTVDLAVASTTTAATTVSSTSTTTEEPRTPNIKDLEDSFGGSSDDEPVATIPPPVSTTKAPNTGFYYLLDWNTFLDIDDQKGKRVNLRFQPKAGDTTKFISVSVP